MSLDTALALDLYRRMLLIRLTEEHIATAYAEQQMRCPVHLCIGQEAIAAGACAALDPGDVVMSTHRSHGHYLAKGGDLYAMLAEIYGKADGCCLGKGGSMHLIDMQAGFLGAVPIVGSTMPIATGTAFASHLRGEKRVSMVFLGEGSTEEGVFHESVQFAALHKLPIVYVCEDNGFSVNTPLDERRAAGLRLEDLARAHTLHVDSGDGNDALGVHALCKRAVDRARAGQGPSFLLLSTYRWLEHCGPNDDHHLCCRSAADFELWKKRCPVDALTRVLLDADVPQQELDALRGSIAAAVADALARAKAAAPADPAVSTMHLYAEAAH
ncbi:thiamine pyrophosphate-dependent dehydrogenase E1 component subunit alpha [Humidesulfovibrio idahonensis]